MPNQFQIDVERIRQQASSDMASGAVTATYGEETGAVVDVLQDVVATELVCWARYQQHAIVAAGINRAQVSAEFTEHAAAEMNHAMSAAERINQLGGTPNLDLSMAAKRSHTDYRTFDDTDLYGMLRENLIAERIVIQIYQEMIRWLADRDPSTRRLLERILEEEEEHADDLRDLLGLA
jgi:bacterioferritin